MAREIEHKFLVISDTWKEHASEGIAYAQSYLSEGVNTVRVRIAGDKGILTLKGQSQGISRLEYEYEIPIQEAKEMMANLSLSEIVEKTRYLCCHAGKQWEVDVFHGANDGLVIAEIELEHENEAFDIPEWAGECVSLDSKYANACLAVRPYSTW